MTLLADLMWQEATALGEAVLVVPLGSTGQHGPHLPLSTDTDVASVLALRGPALRTDVVVVVAPALPYGASGEHACFPGTCPSGRPRLLLVELVRSTDHIGRVLLLSGNGGNADAARAATQQPRREGPDAAWCACGVPGGDTQDGRGETALLLVLRPDAVQLPGPARAPPHHCASCCPHRGAAGRRRLP